MEAPRLQEGLLQSPMHRTGGGLGCRAVRDQTCMLRVSKKRDKLKTNGVKRVDSFSYS